MFLVWTSFLCWKHKITLQRGQVSWLKPGPLDYISRQRKMSSYVATFNSALIKFILISQPEVKMQYAVKKLSTFYDWGTQVTSNIQKTDIPVSTQRRKWGVILMFMSLLNSHAEILAHKEVEAGSGIKVLIKASPAGRAEETHLMVLSSRREGAQLLIVMPGGKGVQRLW